MIMKWFVIFHLHILKAMKVILPKYLLLSEKRNSPALYQSNEKDFIHYLQQNNLIFFQFMSCISTVLIIGIDTLTVCVDFCECLLGRSRVSLLQCEYILY